MKKGMLEVQFNWIFILIVGAMILMFFVGLTMWYKDFQDQKMASSVMTKIQAIMTGAGVNPRTAQKIDVPRIELNFECEPDCNDYGCYSNFKFENTGVAKDTSMDILFTQSSMKTDFIHAWTQEWDMPYKVTNFLYFSTPAVRFYLVYDPSIPESERLAELIYAKLDDNKFIDARVIKASEVSGLKYNNEYLVRFVFFYEPAGVVSVSESMYKSEQWDVIFIDGNEKSGIVTFSSLSGNNMAPDIDKKYPYIGTASLIGAIYSEEYEFYKCNMIKAFLKLRAVNQVYKIRAQDLYHYYEGDVRCEFYYDDLTLGAEFDKIDDAVSDYDNIKTSQLTQSISKIEEINQQAKVKSCTRIY